MLICGVAPRNGLRSRVPEEIKAQSIPGLRVRHSGLGDVTEAGWCEVRLRELKLDPGRLPGSLSR